MTTTTYDAIVIGGGVVGAATAYHLVRAGVKTLLIDRHDVGRATDAGAGILAPELSASYPDAWFNFAVAATAYYPTLLDQLQADGGGETSYAVCGMLTVAATEDEVPAFTRAKEIILARQASRQAPTIADLHEVSAQEARELFPPLTDVLGAIYFRHAARVNGRHLNRALQQAAQNRGLTIRQGSVDHLLLQGSHVTGVAVGGENIAGERVVIAGGAWSSAFGAQLGVQIPVAPQRGQIAHFDLPDQETAHWPVITAYHGHYIVCWPGGRVVCGATREPGAGYAPHTTVSGVHEVLGEALRVAPGLAPAQLYEMRVGLRPYPADGLPILSAVPGWEGVVVVTGHGPTGLTLGPYSGKIAADLVQGQAAASDIRAFNLARFQ